MTNEELIRALEALLEGLRTSAPPIVETWKPEPEPDPWPTEPLIVADRGGRVNRRGLFARWQTDEDYVDIAGVTSDDVYDLATRTLDSLTNVVPVTVVAVAEWEALKSDHRTRSHLADGCHICALIAATEALGVQK